MDLPFLLSGSRIIARRVTPSRTLCFISSIAVAAHAEIIMPGSICTLNWRLIVKKCLTIRSFLFMLLFLSVSGTVCRGEGKGLPASKSELPSDPVCCNEVKALLAALPDFNSAPVSPARLRTGQKQLFLDNHVLAGLENVKRQLHLPQKYGPVIRPDQPWEGESIQIRMGPSWNPQEKLWMLFYLGGGYATSRDGLHWDKPVVGLQRYKGSKENNLLIPVTTYEDGSFYDSAGRFTTKIFRILEGDGTSVRPVFYDAKDPDPKRRFKGFGTEVPFGPMYPAVSPDGRKWELLKTSSISSQDEFHLFHDTSRNLYVATVKLTGPYGRSVYLAVSKDFEHWTDSTECLIFHADKRDQKLGAERVQMHLRNPALRQPTFNRPEEYRTDIYNLPVFAYQGLYVGIPTVFNHSGNTKDNSDGFSMVELAVSRDLINWERVGNREKFIPLSPVEGEKNYDTAQLLVGNEPIITDTEIWFYYSGLKWRDNPIGKEPPKDTGAICLAKLRLDGFVSLDAGATEGAILTKPIVMEGKSLHVNVTAPQGEVRAEILDAEGKKVLSGFSRGECVPVAGDSLNAELKWKKAAVSTLVGKTVRLRFILRNVSLYAFWAGN